LTPAFVKRRVLIASLRSGPARRCEKVDQP
jgi:hypothetical protein